MAARRPFRFRNPISLTGFEHGATLVTLEAGVVFGTFMATGFHIAGMVEGHEPNWGADEQVVVFSAITFVALWEWRAARRPAVKHYDADGIEILPPERRT
jgi:membrane protein implicated in regulation of membrane protease activity